MFSKITSLLRSSSDVEDLKNEIKILNDAQYRLGDESFEAMLVSRVRISIATIMREEIENTKMSVKDYLAKLEAEIDKLETLELTIAFEPPAATVDRIYNHVNKGREMPLLLRFRINKYIIGGVIVAYKGTFRDYSLARVLEEELFEKRERIAKMLFTSMD